MSKEKKADGKIQWGRMIRKLNPYTIQKGFRYLKHTDQKNSGSDFMRDLNQRKYLMVHGMKLMYRI